MLKVYRSGGQNVLREEDVLGMPELLAAWEMVVAEIWTPEFD